MIKNLYVKSDFEAVFLINGAFTECAESISIDDEAVYFITALPLNAAFLVRAAAAESALRLRLLALAGKRG